jgi:putative Mg2+ transporter-C (MgtC) family protein
MDIQTIVLRRGLSLLLGSIIGWEREAVEKPAGLRTLTRVCVGSTLFIQVTLDLIRAYAMPATWDPLRIVAAIIQGIGFLGAGTVLHQGEHVKGLTTAAALWAVTAVGVAVGFGMYTLAIAGTVMIFVILRPIARFHARWIGTHSHTHEE